MTTNTDKWAVIIGDVVSSRSMDQRVWLPILEDSIKDFSDKYDIFRGDSFQIQLQLNDAFNCVYYIKAIFKSIGLDVRLGIGVGSIDHNEDTIKVSSGAAFVLSGEAFDELEKETLAFKSDNVTLDTQINLLLQLSTELTNRWTRDMGSVVAAAIKNPTLNQKDLAKLLNKKHQSQISTHLSKSGFAKIKRVVDYATNEVIDKC